jgi:hypothetical protein
VQANQRELVWHAGLTPNPASRRRARPSAKALWRLYADVLNAPIAKRMAELIRQLDQHAVADLHDTSDK